MLVSSCVVVGCSGGGSGGVEQSAGEPGGTSNRAPRVSGWPDPEVTARDPYSFKPTAADADGDELMFSIANKPEWASFNAATGRLFGEPGPSDIGKYSNIQITVSDGVASTTLPAFNITVNHVGIGSVTLSWMPPTQNADGSPLTDLAGYRIYVGRSPRNFTRVIALTNPGLTAYVVEDLGRASWHFAMTSVNSSGRESARSAVVRKFVG
jgi:Putative Ig domain